MISLDKCNESCDSVDDLSCKICFPNKTKSVNVKVFNMITKINETKTLIKHISCNYKFKFDNTTCNLNQKWNNETCQYEYNNIVNAQKNIIEILANAFENGKNSKSIVDESVIVCYEIIDITTNVPKIVRNTLSIYSNDKKIYKKI